MVKGRERPFVGVDRFVLCILSTYCLAFSGTSSDFCVSTMDCTDIVLGWWCHCNQIVAATRKFGSAYPRSNCFVIFSTLRSVDSSLFER